MLDSRRGRCASTTATLFKLEHMLKDVRLCLEEAQAAGVPFPAGAAARDQLRAALGRALGDQDFAALAGRPRGLRRTAVSGPERARRHNQNPRICRVIWSFVRICGTITALPLLGSRLIRRDGIISLRVWLCPIVVWSSLCQ